MLAAFLASFMMGFDPSVLTIPPEIRIDPKEIWIDKLAECESNASSTIRILDVNKKYSHGLLMFQMGTWLSYGKEFGATKENIYDPELQRKVARAMLDDGGQKHWYVCSKKIPFSYGKPPPASLAGTPSR